MTGFIGLSHVICAYHADVSLEQAEAVVGGQIACAVNQHNKECRAAAAAAKGTEPTATTDSTPKASFSR